MKKVNNNSFTSKPKKTAIAQYRISSGKQEREWDSFGNQDVNCKKYCSDNNIELVKIFKETVTWKKSAEETFKESIEYGKNNKIDYFIIFDIDRFTRDWYGTYEKVKKNMKNRHQRESNSCHTNQTRTPKPIGLDCFLLRSAQNRTKCDPSTMSLKHSKEPEGRAGMTDRQTDGQRKKRPKTPKMHPETQPPKR